MFLFLTRKTQAKSSSSRTLNWAFYRTGQGYKEFRQSFAQFEVNQPQNLQHPNQISHTTEIIAPHEYIDVRKG